MPAAPVWDFRHLIKQNLFNRQVANEDDAAWLMGTQDKVESFMQLRQTGSFTPKIMPENPALSINAFRAYVKHTREIEESRYSNKL